MTDNFTIATSLLHADSEEEVIEILTKAGYWSDESSWRLLGDKDGNFSTVGNQQARPEAALVEKIVNSVDARLLNECLIRRIDPESTKAPQSIPHAISVLIDGLDHSTAREGTIADWPASKQLDQARLITVSVTGNKPKQGRPCITIADAGEGQAPAKFADTFLSIDKSNKLRIPFVQGKFNMGGTGVLKFCGSHSLQLIISRRNPQIFAQWDKSGTKWASSDARDSEWGFTVVRRERPTGTSGDVRNSVFKYLAPITAGDGSRQVLSFKADALKIFPKENKPYDRAAHFGTAIKLYEYDTKGFGSHALMKDGLQTRLEALLPEIALPARVHECRNYRGEAASSFANNLVGLSVRLGENRGDNLEERYPTTSTFVVRGEQMTAQIFAFKNDRAEGYRTNEGIIFTINGQTHGSIPKTFFERSRVKMGRLARSLIVLVDCSGMSVGAREDLFMNSRDRLSNGELRKVIESELEDIIGKHPGLRALRERRREAEIANRLEESKAFDDVIQSIIKSSPTLSRLFRFGQRLSQPNRADIDDKIGGGRGKDGGKATFEGKPHPSYFRFYKRRSGEELHRNAEIGRRCRIKFETDVQNDYFERPHLRGKYEVEVLDGVLEGLSLDHNLSIHDGIANWSIGLPDDRLEPGDTIRLQCTVNDETLITPLVNVASITLTPIEKHADQETSYARLRNYSGGIAGLLGSGPNDGTGSNLKPGSETSGGIDPPKPIPVRRNDTNWLQHHFSDATACKIIEDGDGFTFYVNVDNTYLHTEMKDGKEDVGAQRAKFIWGNVLIALALIHDHKQRRANSSDEDEGKNASIFATVEETTRAIAPFLVPMIDHLGALSGDEISSAASSGDDD